MASGVAATPDGKTILVADRDDNAVSVIDAGTFARVATIPVGQHPFGVTIDAAGARAYSANVELDDVSVIDLAARKVVGDAEDRKPALYGGAGGRAAFSSPTSTPTRSASSTRQASRRPGRSRSANIPRGSPPAATGRGSMWPTGSPTNSGPSTRRRCRSPARRRPATALALLGPSSPDRPGLRRAATP